MKQKMKKSLSYFLSSVLLLTTVNTTVLADTSAKTSDILLDDAVNLNYNKQMKDNGNGTYTLAFSADAYSDIVAKNLVRTEASTGEFVVPSDGDYMVQVWGGRGGSGASTGIFTNKAGGAGGASGYVEGMLSLQEGQILYYNIGSNGTTTLSENEGGINGNGGSHGDSGNWGVGSGGGYSAVFLYDNEADKIANVNDRSKDYIMIAGGGGGGSGASLLQNRPGYGGNGGNMQSASAQVSAENNNGISGRYFAGSNGTSNTYDDTYVGIGATDVPGKANSTIWGFAESASGNDWLGTYDPSLKPGAGGNGNGRGAGGGAGFAGGSGAAQETILTGYSAAGGGGGSSFIADSVGTIPNDKKSILGYENPSETGGSIVITRVPSSGTDLDIENLSNATFSGTVSEYFDIVSVSNSGTYDNTTHKFSISNIDLKFEKHSIKSSGNIEVVLKPREGFAGGNNVPVLLNSSLNSNQSSGHTTYSFDIPQDADTDYVNVPLNLKINANTVQKKEGETVSKTELYVNDISDFESTGDYAFIDTISQYKIVDTKTSQIMGDSFSAPSETTKYSISSNVVPKYNPAKVGTAITNPTVISAIGVVDILEDQTNIVDGAKVKYTKRLEYNAGSYDLILDTHVTPAPSSYVYSISSTPEIISGNKYTPTSDGYYYIQLKGATGGSGGKATVDGLFEDDKRDGGTGGTGASIEAMVYLTSSDTLNITTGTEGDNGDKADTSNNLSRNPAASKGGAGGGCTYVQLRTDYIAIAGGGGGGTGAVADVYFGNRDGKAGIAGLSSDNNPSQTLGSVPNDYNGAKGDDATAIKNGRNTPTTSVGNPGAAGASYVGSDYVKSNSEYSDVCKDITPPKFNWSSSNGNGEVKIYKITATPKSGATEKLNLTGTISKYFTITGVEVSGATSGYSTNVGSTTENAGTDFNFTNVTAGASGDVTYVIHMTPREGFVGGNDVPVLSNENGITTGMRLHRNLITSPNDDDIMDIDENDSSDYANVEINYDIESITATDKTIVKGDSVAVSEIASVDIPNTSTWKWDYAKFNYGVVDTDTMAEYQMGDSVSPVITTDYNVFAKVEPKAENTKAVVVSKIDDKNIGKNATVFVEYPVTYHLTNLTATNNNNAKYQEKYQTSIVGTGYVMPESIVVKSGGTTLTADVDYTYNKDTGVIVINSVTDVIDITAAATPKTYKLKFMAFNKNGILVSTHENEYEAGASIQADIDWANSYKATTDSTIDEGYEFVWDYGTNNNTTVMPANNMEVYGVYVKKQYNITINYKYSNGTQAAESLNGKLCWDENYEVASPTIDNYIANQLVVSGVMPKHDVVIDVIYSPVELGKHNVTVYYVYAESGTLISATTQQIVEGGTYNITSPAVEGYEADQAVISGTMGTEDVSKTVKYTEILVPITVTFDANGGKLSGNVGSVSQTYYKGKPYGYITEGFPVAVRAMEGNVRYEFEGWYTAETGGELIKSTDIVQNSATVYAHWLELSTNITYDANGGKYSDDSHAKSVIGTYGSVYPIAPETPVKSGYSFLGWSTSNSATTANIVPGTTVFGTASARTLYAVWHQDDSAVIYFRDGEEIIQEIKPDEIAEFYNLELIPAPVSSGYFKGWKNSVSGEVKPLVYKGKVYSTVIDNSGADKFTAYIDAMYYESNEVESNIFLSKGMAQHVILKDSNGVEGDYIRFISLLSDANWSSESGEWDDYSKSGFVITTFEKNNTPTTEAGIQYNTVTTVYQNVRSRDEYVSAKGLGGKISFANSKGILYTNYPIKAGKEDTKIAATPYILKNDGTYIYGKTRVVTLNELIALDEVN